MRSKKTILMNKTTLMNLYDIIFVNCLKCWVINYKTLRVLSLISFSVWLSFFGAERLACCQTMLETSLLLTMPVYTSAKGRGKNKIQGITSVEGPHSIEIISIIFGSLLGVGHAERIKNGSGACRSQGTRVVFFQEAMHVKYLL